MSKLIKLPPADVYKAIIELSTSKSSREISKEVKEKFDYDISHVTVNKILKQCREERAEIFKAKFTEEVSLTLPEDLELIRFFQKDLYNDYNKLTSAQVITKTKIIKCVGDLMNLKYANMGSKETGQQDVNWERYLEENEFEDYLF